MAFAPSAYQQAIYDRGKEMLRSKKKENLVVDAGPGSGKTTTLVNFVLDCIPESKWDSTVYVAFNSHIVQEVEEKFPTKWHSRWRKEVPIIQCRTLHSVGRGAISSYLRKERPGWQAPGYRGQDWIDGNIDKKYAQDWMLEHQDEHQVEADEWRETVNAIDKLVSACQLTMTDHTKPDRIWKVVAWYGLDDIAPYCDLAIKALPEIFARKIREMHKVISFNDMIWLPLHLNMWMWQYDIVLADESQDFNRAQRWLVQRITRKTGTSIWVGDKRQCQPIGTMIRMADHSLKPIEDIQLGEKVLSYHRGSGYYRSQAVTGTASREYFGLMYEVSAGGKSTLATDNHKWLVRWANLDAEKHAVYLMRNHSGQYRIGYCQLFTQINSGTRRRGKDLGLAGRMRSENAEAGWILKVCDTNTEAFQYEQIWSAQYGIPQLRFTSKGSEKISQHEVNFVHDSVDSEIGAIKLLKTLNKDSLYPLIDRSENQQRRGGSTSFITQSCNLIPGYMEIPVPPEELTYKPHRSMVDDWRLIEVTAYQSNETVYSLDVDTTHLYVADGLLTHNSIYGFAFASTRSIDEIIDETKAEVLPLGICYRCPTTHIDLCLGVHPDSRLEPRPGAPVGTIEDCYDFQVADQVEPGDLILCRVNAPLIPLCFQLIRQGIGAKVKGRDIGKNLISLAEKIEKQRDDGINWKMPHDSLRQWAKGEAELLYRRIKDEEAAMMAVSNLNDKIDNLIAIWEGNRPSNLKAFVAEVEALFSDDKPSVWLSTIHKAKGLEADNVFILKPSKMPHPMARRAWEREQEQNMMYIAYSRAKQRLFFAWSDDEPGCPAIPVGPDDQPTPEQETAAALSLEEIVEQALVTCSDPERKQLIKIQKLLALATKNDNVHQAEAALSKARAMMRAMGLLAEDEPETAEHDGLLPVLSEAA